MICASCQAPVPDESHFCLRCGTRLVALERLAPVNGGKTGRTDRAAVAVSRPAPGPGRPAASPGRPAAAAATGKEPYALSFMPLADPGVRRRVASWLCQVAPAHPLPEVQQRLSAGGFATFLALTPAEADAARARIEALGAHPAFFQLRPASVAEMLLPQRPAAARRTGLTTQHKIAAGIGVFIFVICCIFSWMLFTRTPAKPPAAPGGVPRIGARP
jgi:hypothetical protein